MLKFGFDDSTEYIQNTLQKAISVVSVQDMAIILYIYTYLPANLLH